MICNMIFKAVCVKDKSDNKQITKLLTKDLPYFKSVTNGQNIE